MSELLPPSSLLAAFAAASVVLALTPGPGVLYIITRSIAQGRRSGLASVAGVALGNLVNAIAAACGLAALFAVSATAFMLVKFAGAAYLIYLGIRLLLRMPNTTAAAGDTATQGRRVFRDGLIVALFNPKTTIFFAAFLPQFMSSNADPMVQGLTLGTMFVAIAAVTDSIYALTAGAITPWLQRAKGRRRSGRYLVASLFIGLGLFTALGGSQRTANAWTLP